MTRRVLPFERALETSRMVMDAASVMGAADARATWRALTGTDDRTDSPNVVADAAFLAMPEEHAAVLRRATGTPAAFALKAIAEVMAKAFPRRQDGSADTGGAMAWELRACMKVAWRIFADRSALAVLARHGFGWDLSDAWEVVKEVEERKWNRDLVEQVARLAGRMYEAIRGVRVKRDDGDPQEIKDVIVGGDLTRLMPVEFAQLGSSSEFALLAQMRVIERKAMQFRMAGEKEVGRGPLAIAQDESGSMADERNVWAKSAAVAMARVAHEENRVVRFVHFSTHTAVQECRPGDQKAMLEVVHRFLGGGTDIGLAVREAHAQTKDLEKHGWVGADIVVISDGEDYRSQGIAAEVDAARARGVKLWTVAIDCDLDPVHPLREKAERYVHVDNSGLTAEAVKAIGKAASANAVRR